MKNLHHQVAKFTKVHQVNFKFFLVILCELGDLVVRFFSLIASQES
ncbi:MAG: hypothetical protein JNM42_02245 [Propionivibrio sp.]|nr:hypothetical protein [Propionivibrio sp.]MBL8413239.1 hypothetical protein [Propionivibrio sp.]